MPFNPDEYLAKKQTEVPVAASPKQFDPNAYLATKGINTPELDSTTMPSDNASTLGAVASQAGDAYNKYSQNVGQGAALGYGSQLNAGIQAAAGAVDQTINGSNNFGDQSAPDAGLATRALDAISNLGSNYTRAKKGVDEKIAQTRASDPWKAALSEIAGSIAPSFLAGKGLKSLGATSGIAQTGSIGGLYSYGSSDKEGLDRVVDGVEGGAKAILFAKALQVAGKGFSALKNADYGKYLESEYGDYSKPIDAAKDMTASASKENPYALDYKTKFGEPFKLGAEMGKKLTDPNVQSQISQELNNQPKIAQSLIDSTKSRLGTLRDALKASHGEAEVDVNPTFKKIYDFIDNIKTGANDTDRLAAKMDLRQAITGMEDSIGGKDPITNGIKKSTFGDLIDQHSTFGRDVFENKVFNKDSVINGAAKKVWGMLSDSVNKADETVGSGGQISTINKVFKSMYGMEENMINGTTLKSLTDPQAVGADNKFSEFVKPFEELPANVRDTLAPEMHDFLANQFPKTFSKAKIMLLATERGSQASQANKGILSLSALRGLKSALGANVQNSAGALSNSLNGSSLDAISNALQSPQVSGAMQSVAPALGALSTQDQPQGPGALSTVK